MSKTVGFGYAQPAMMVFKIKLKIITGGAKPLASAPLSQPELFVNRNQESQRNEQHRWLSGAEANDNPHLFQDRRTFTKISRKFVRLEFSIMNTKQEKLEAFGRLLNIMDDLREKCPWDQKQTLESLRHLTLEETYELSDAILQNDLQEIKKELGDVLLHLVFYAKIGSEKGSFDIADVINSLNEKLIFRHPHIYGDTEVKDEEEVKQNWEKLKLKEGNKSILGGVPKSLPSLVKAYRIQDKVKGIGFEFHDAEDAWKKVDEEIQEFHAETDLDKKEQELGDVFFSLINYARISGINPDSALERTNLKFISRFQKMETLASEQNLNLADLSLEEMDVLWEKAKRLQ